MAKVPATTGIVTLLLLSVSYLAPLRAQQTVPLDEQLLAICGKSTGSITVDGKPMGLVPAVESLLAQGAHPNAVDSATGNTPLMLTARSGNVVLENLLLDRGAEVNARNRRGAGALTNALLSASEQAVRLLLSKGAMADRSDGGFLDVDTADTPAIIAIRHRWYDLVPDLVKGSAGVNGPNLFGQTPVMEAAWDNDAEMVDYLLSAGADPNSVSRAGSTALSYAASRGSLRIVTALLKKGARPDTRDALGRSPLKLAEALNPARFQDKSAIVGALSNAGGPIEVVTPAGPRPSAPVVVYKSDPEYSEEARVDKFSGSALLSIIIAADGTVLESHIVKMLGKGLDEKALLTVSRWKFKPALSNDVPVAAFATIEINFRLL